jgi:ELWxxDGT repeat protein
MRTRRSIAIAGAAALGLLGAPCGALAQVVLIRDIHPTASSRSYEDLFFVSEEALLFSADDGSTGPALWRSDGTPAGTTLVEDLFGASGSFPAPAQARAVGPLGFFVVADGFTGTQPWRSDGTAAGTFGVTTPMSAGDTIDTVAGFTPWLASVAFQYPSTLWLSDGTASGEVPGPIQLSNFPYVAMDDRLYVYGNTAAAPGTYGLVRTDGTSGGTVLVEADVVPLLGTPVNGRLFLVRSTMSAGTELWVLDPGAASTRLVKDIVPGFASSSPERLTRVDDRLFFTAADPAAGRELWVSDGTEAGTQRVRDIEPGSNGSDPRALTALGGSLYFAATTAAAGTELWRTDGTEAGTQLVVDLNVGPANGLTGVALYGRDDAVAAVNRRVFFQGRPDGFGFGARLWLADADGSGATPLGESAFALGPMRPHNGQLLFTGSQSGTGMELFGVDLVDTLGRTWCAKPEVGIADDETVAQSTIRLPDRGAVYALRVAVDIGHSRIDDIEVALRHVETGTRVVLLDVPACESDLLDIELADDAAAPADSGCALADVRLAYPRDTTWRPLEPLSAFDGEPLAGRWRLEVRDGLGGNVGTLHEWCLTWSGPELFADGFEDPF